MNVWVRSVFFNSLRTLASGLVLSLTLPLLAHAQTAKVSPREDWNFTKQDYTSLKAKGGKLRFEADSSWFPQVFKANLLLALDYALDPALTPPKTDGVNKFDFYHGHVACERPNTLPSIAEENFAEGLNQYKTEEVIFERHGLSATDDATPQNLQKIIQITKEMDLACGAFLARILSEGNCAKPLVLYHTYENNGARSPNVTDEMRLDRSYANILIKSGATAPEKYIAPNPLSASSWMQEFSDLLQFAFLVDQKGVVHVTCGSTTQLSKITKRPETGVNYKLWPWQSEYY